MTPLFDLSGRVALVTGGNGGIGRSIALAFADAGASEAILGRNPEKNQRALGELPPNYRRAFMLRRCDDLPPEQIAEQLNVRLRMVRKYISRATIYCKLRVDGLSAVEARKRVLT